MMKMLNRAMKVSGLDFWRFFFLALISPVKRGHTVDRHHFINGTIVFGIYAFLTGLNTYSQTRMFIPAEYHEVEGVSFFSTMILPFVYTAVSLFIIAGIIMIVALLMRSGAHYPDVVARFGSMLVIPTLISLVIFIFTVSNATESMIFFFISLLSMIGLFAAIFFTVHSYYDEDESGLDPFFAVLLTFIGIGFIAFVFKSSVFSGFFYFMV